MVDDDLSAVGEVAELGFPEGEHFGVGEGVSVVEAEDGEFGEEGIMDTEFRLVG